MKARQFIVDLCKCFNINRELFTEPEPTDYLKDRFKEKGATA